MCKGQTYPNLSPWDRLLNLPISSCYHLVPAINILMDLFETCPGSLPTLTVHCRWNIARHDRKSPGFVASAFLCSMWIWHQAVFPKFMKSRFLHGGLHKVKKNAIGPKIFTPCASQNLLCTGTHFSKLPIAITLELEHL